MFEGEIAHLQRRWNDGKGLHGTASPAKLSNQSTRGSSPATVRGPWVGQGTIPHSSQAAD